MAASSDERQGDRAKSATFPERFYEPFLRPDGSRENNAENDLIAKFYASMIGYVVELRSVPADATPKKHSSPEPMSPYRGPADCETSLNAAGRETAAVADEKNVVRIAHLSGNVFEGLVSEGIPHGPGRLFLSDGGVTYEGRFEDGLPDGAGVVKWSDGSWYDGEFRRGLRHGRGMHVSAADGRRWYGGRWTDGELNGPAGRTACCAAGSDGAFDYAGDWVAGRPHGRGSASWPDGTRYTGRWASGRPHGAGRAVWPSNDVYDGDWVDGYMDGTGEYEWNSNPGDNEKWVVLCLCDRYNGQWSKSKKHGLGEFYSAETGTTIRGSWVDDALDGPCEIVLSDGRRPGCSGLAFRRNVLYETPPPPRTGYRRPAWTAGRGRRPDRLPAAVQTTDSAFKRPHGSDTGRGPRPVRADVRLTDADAGTACDLTGHVRRAVTKCWQKHVAGCPCKTAAVTDALDLERELRAAECALESFATHLKELYRAYGAFLADGPVAYRPLMTRLGLWQVLVDSGLHARLSLADFDDLLYENGECAFRAAHDPFEPVYYWQFVHAVCELASAVYDARRPEDRRGLLASALRRLFAEHVRPDVVVPVSYAAAVGGDNGSWMNSRKTMARMYTVYQTMATADEPLPTARRLIRLYGPQPGGGEPPFSLDSVLPAVLDVALGLRDELAADCAVAAAAAAAEVYACSVESVVATLSEACPTIVDARGVLVASETRLTFADWYRFVMLYVRDGRLDTGRQSDAE